jgi:neopullulanase
MKSALRKLLFLSLVLIASQAISQVSLNRIDPPSWWTGMADSSLQLLVYGNQISEANVIADYRGVVLKKITKLENPDYLVLDLEISRKAKPGNISLVFEYQREILFTYDYPLMERIKGSAARQGFGKDDVIYLIMPDRFSNGDPANDSVPGMLEKANRINPDGRHGGDIKGISDKLDYIADLGITAIWLTPVQENNMAAYSYHGYAITDLYRVDPRFGTNDQYRSLVDDCHKKGIKVIMDMVFNHCGGNHYWIKDLPSQDWIHQFPEFTRSNFRAETVMDPYASDFDLTRMQTGWFDKPMPDLNQHNPVLANYLIQNSIWWVEFAGLDGIRMDTYAYSYSDFMADWMRRLLKEYPNFNVVGETWLQKETHTAYWQKDAPVGDKQANTGLPCITDFPMDYALKDAFNEQDGWTSGLAKIYYVLAQDFVYSDPFRNIIFADNHDLYRFYSSIGMNYNKFRMAMAVMLTTRGIPTIYYGTELLMTGEKDKGDGFIREDFPLGSWQLTVDSLHSLVVSRQSSVDSLQLEALQYMKTLLNWRKNSEVIHNGRLMQFVPNDGIYVYFRYSESNAVMVIVNKNKDVKKLDLSRFNEILKDYSKGTDVATGVEYVIGNSMDVPAETSLILDLIAK